MPQLEAWHWVAFGMVLVMLEIVVPSFTIIWFGLGAIIVSGLLFISPEASFSLQLLCWTLTSSLLTVGWFLVLQPHMKDRTKAGSLEALLGQSGQVITPPHADARRGLLRFSTPLVGEDEWQFICEESVSSGDRVTVTDVSGNTLIVKKK